MSRAKMMAEDGRRQALMVAALALTMAWLLAPVALGQEEAATAEAPVDTGLYLSTFWLIFAVLTAAGWVAAMEWLNRDAVAVGEDAKRWNLILFLVGALLWYAGWKISLRGFTVLLLFAMGGLFMVYIRSRNLKVPANYRLFTPEHLNDLGARLLTQMGIQPKAMGVKSTREDRTSIVLMKKDGTTASALADGRRAEHAEAIVASKEIVENAIRARATDIHLEPKGTELQVRYRIDGILHNSTPFPAELGKSIVSSVKVLSDMDIAERRKAQDGSFSATLDDKKFDVRVSTLTSVHGETMVLRLLDSSGGVIKNGLSGLGFTPDMLKQVTGVIHSPHGCLITSGPTGSGKTTTLYAALSEIDAYQRNIVTIENPIEYKLDNVTQTPINPEAGITFASTLRAILRQDPDVIMVGEIRDAETARTALQAAMTGHFVFTTLHANDSVTSIVRLLDLGIESSLIQSALTVVVAQRLVRLLCNDCKVPYTPNQEFLRKIRVTVDEEKTFYKAKGCEECQGTGYRGRTGIYEVLMVTDGLRELIKENPSLQDIKNESRRAGLITLQEDGLRKVMQGLTSIKEVIRVTK